MVLLGARGCGASRGTPMLAALLDVRDSLRATARRRGIPFAFIGVALDQDPDVGLRWLQEIGGFDEISAGGGLLNAAVTEYVWRQSTGMVVTPEVIVGLRPVASATNRRLKPMNMEILLRMLGQRDILSRRGLRDVDSLLMRRTRR
jgi:hypothetical protein